MSEDQYIEVGHVIACHNDAALRWDIFCTLPISFHQEIEDGNDDRCADSKGQVGT
jgi:hypothetical protein